MGYPSTRFSWLYDSFMMDSNLFISYSMVPAFFLVKSNCLWTNGSSAEG